MNGIEIIAKLREQLGRHIPAIMLTGDISTGALDAISRQDCVQFNKPVKLPMLSRMIQVLLRRSQSAARVPVPPSVEMAGSVRPPVIFVVDDDNNLREVMRAVLEDDGRNVEDYATCEAFFEAYRPGQEACLVIDAYLPGMNGLELLQRLEDAGHRLPAIMITGNSDVSIAVRAMKAGALDFIEKPVGRGELLAAVERALTLSRDSSKLFAWRETAADRTCRTDAATAPDHGAGAFGPPQQEHRRGPAHQSAHRRESPQLDHEEDRLEIYPGVGPIGDGR